MALYLETDEARRCMYMLLRATAFRRGSEGIPAAERIHEALFVFWRRRRLPGGDFEIKKDGCYSPSLALALEEAVRSGEVAHEVVGGLDAYSLTERGIAAAKGPWDAAELRERVDASMAKYKMTDINYKELVSFLYGSFPDTWKDPPMKSKAKEWGFEAACSMYDRAKVSIGGGARMSYMDYEEFIWAFAAAGYTTFKTTVEELDRFIDELHERNNTD
ncbi:MAG: hypothetical protein MPI82_06515 [Nitrosopumilus sp.]|nr:hypothetical protein [Nitrosopumilus sp.]